MAEGVTCTNCGFHNAADAQFCGNCAQRLQPLPGPSHTAGTVYCPFCEQPNPPGSPYCGHCGQPLANTSTAAPHHPSAWERCPHCGQTNPAGATFCGECGRSLVPGSSPPGGPNSERQKKGIGNPLTLLIILAGLIFFGALAVVVLLRTGNPPDDDPKQPTITLAEAGSSPEAADTATEPPPPTATTTNATPTAPPTVTPLPTPTTNPTPTKIPTPTASPTSVTDKGPEALVLGTTSRGTPIEAVRFGNGPTALLFIGGLSAGFAPSTVTLARTAVEHFSRNPELIPANITLYIILSASPDTPVAPGEYRGRLNANGVDVNRNWDCQWAADTRWQGETKRGSGGTAPFSEAESRILRDFIEEEEVAAVIFWQARAEGGLASPGGCGDRVNVSAALAGIYGLNAGYRVENFEDLTRQTLNGDASNYLDSVGVPAVSILLPNYSSSIDWENNLRGTLAVLNEYAD